MPIKAVESVKAATVPSPFAGLRCAACARAGINACTIGMSGEAIVWISGTSQCISQPSAARARNAAMSRKTTWLLLGISTMPSLRRAVIVRLMVSIVSPR